MATDNVEPFDLVVIGAGPAGEKGAAQAAYFGKRVAVVEREAQPGGAAVHTGTLPSKTLRETALFLSGYRQLDLYGVTVEVESGLAVAKLIARKDAVRRSETARILRNLDAHGIEQVRGEARFLDRQTVEVVAGDGARRLSAQVFLIATGSHPFRPPSIPFEDPDVHDSNDILGIERLPGSLAVLGGGVIGCEYASMFAALGVEVHLVEGRDSLLPFLDHEIGERLLAGMTHLGVHPHLEERAETVGRDPDGRLTCRLTSGTVLACDQVLVASGRSGNTAGLQLEAVGVETDARGYVDVDDGFRTSVPGIYAAGDVVGFPALASASMEQARVAVCRAFGFDYKQEVSSLLPYGVYTIPEVSCVGLGEREAEAAGIDAVVGRAFFKDNARGQILGDREGMIKLVFDRATRALVGCHCIGERASELVHVGEVAITLAGTVETFIETVFNYPTLGEAYKYAAYDALGRMGPAGSDAPEV
ncbi:MAG: Si-specific NAD(P)(+) transhydrogenase [Actinomycetota bacterium]